MTYEEQKQLLEDFHKEMTSVLEKKGNDYSNVDCLSNFKATAGITQQKPENVVLTMIGIKIARLGVLLNTEKEVKNESIKDSIIDLANYAFLLKCAIEDRQRHEVSVTGTVRPFTFGDAYKDSLPLFDPLLEGEYMKFSDNGSVISHPICFSEPMKKLNVKGTLINPIGTGVNETLFRRSAIEVLQSKVFKVVGKGKVMELFNEFLGIKNGK